ncbi:MAG: nucleotidyltransferase domain-containing protein [Dictyoglomus sp.]|nr:nucleotidyltransferase domain-containing protein [Dictyoglomus sp.]MDW8189175.1 nucleotidyltransferase domain-containing protein [Dictyoglomus sp.]
MKYGRRSISINLTELISKLKENFEEDENIIFAYLFGGLAKNRISPISDIDIAVYLRNVANIVNEKIRILNKICDSLKYDDVDLIILNMAPISLKGRILQNRIVIIDKDPSLRYSFESLTLRMFFDFSIKEKQILYRRYKLG